jgi:hypothetical protein
MVIHKSDGSTERIAVADINKITFTLLPANDGLKPETLKKIKAIGARIIPNPFNTKIEYMVSELSDVRIYIFNMNGQIVKTLKSRKEDKGIHTAVWDATVDTGKKVVNDSYIVNVDISGKKQF